MKLCKLVIHDQCNASFAGLDALTRRLCNKELKFFIHAAKHTPAYRLGRWDGCISFFAVNGNTFVNVIDKVLSIVIDAGYDIELEDHRPDNQFEFSDVTETYLSDNFDGLVWPKHHAFAGSPILLRDYQVDVIKTALDNLQSVQEIATSAGKTIICAALSHLCEDYGRTIIIVPNKDLVKQTEIDYKNIGLDVGVYFGDRKDFGNKHLICTWQSLSVILKNQTQGKGAFTIEEFIKDVVGLIVDECLDGNVNITTPEGLKPIKDIQIGDLVYSFNEASKTFCEDIVIDKHENLSNSITATMHEIVLANGTILEITSNHKVLTECGWKQVKDLVIGDDIINYL